MLLTYDIDDWDAWGRVVAATVRSLPAWEVA